MEEIQNNSEKQKPLVTIAVTTYNSAEYVVETLNSVKGQTYDNIELIITDDGSKDNSVAICKDWLEKNKYRFVRTLVIVGENIGVSGNTNRALYAAQGEWWKDLAGDDIMPPDAVEKHLKYIEEHPDICYFFGKEINFYGDFSEGNFEPLEIPFRHVFFGTNVTVQRQFKLLTRHFFGAPTASFGKVEAIKSVGGYNEKIPMTEDGPLYLALTKAGYRLGFMDEYSIYRRIHAKSLSHTIEENAIITSAEIRNFQQYSFRALQAENCTLFWKGLYKISNKLWWNVIETGNDRSSLKCRFYNVLRRFLNPQKIYLIILHVEEYILRRFYSSPS